MDYSSAEHSGLRIRLAGHENDLPWAKLIFAITTKRANSKASLAEPLKHVAPRVELQLMPLIAPPIRFAMPTKRGDLAN